MQSEELQINQALLRLPHFGHLTRCTDRGFGFLDGLQNDSFVHISDHLGKRLQSLENLEGQPCAFTLGGHPFRYINEKKEWYKTVVQWTLLGENSPFQSSSKYFEARKDTLLALSFTQLVSLLKADWYVKLWWQKASTSPKSIVQSDKILDSVLEERLASVDDLGQLVELLAAICKSPWYAIDAQDRQKTITAFFKGSSWPRQVFVGNHPLAEISHFDEIESLCGTDIYSCVSDANTISIDIESDGRMIFQLGWKNYEGSELRESLKGLSETELQRALDDCIGNLKSPVFVGHNIFRWDWPILQANGATFPIASRRWDTLIASWILQPWRKTHALIVKENAHRADADADACFKLFKEQIKQLSPCPNGSVNGIEKLVDHLFSDSTLLSKLEGRGYPQSITRATDGAVVYPSNRALELAWLPNCPIDFHSAKNALLDPVLSPEICRGYAKEHPDIYVKAVSVVVEDAKQNGVEVRLSHLPSWLVDDRLKQALQDSHRPLEGKGWSDSKPRFLIAEDLFDLPDEAIEELCGHEQSSVRYGISVAEIWVRTRREQIAWNEIEDNHPDLDQQFRTRSLIPIRRPSKQAEWLLYEPPGYGENEALWSVLPSLPEWLHSQIDTKERQGFDFGSVSIPRWRDGGITKLDLDRVFVSTETINRELYLAELLHCVLNLTKTLNDDEVCLVSLRRDSEARALQKHLETLGLSSTHDGTPLRRLEHTCTKGFRVLCCTRDEIAKFVEASVELDKHLIIAIDELPVHEWHAMLHQPESDAALNLSDEKTERVSVDDTEAEDDVTDDDFSNPVHSGVVFTRRDIENSTSLFLASWLHGLAPSADSGSLDFLILDSRLSIRSRSLSPKISAKNIPFFSLEELLDDSTLTVFYEICFPRSRAKDIPRDYETYRNFLESNWGFQDFLPGTQRPIIERLIENDRDMLIRLPTGAGKSVLFHLPALLRSNYTGRLTVVITPLRALMRDQVKGLWEKQFFESVDYLSGGRDASVNAEVYQGILDGRIRLVFVAPERFRVSRFTDVLNRRRILDGGLEFVVFDETHCVSEWGFEFRPDYLYAANFVAKWFREKDRPGNPHRVILTSATVTQRNRVDLEHELGLGKDQAYEDLPEDMPHPIQSYINLEAFNCEEEESAPTDQKFEQIIELLAALDLRESAALIFVQRRSDCHRLAEALSDFAATTEDERLRRIQALPFHAGLSETVKAEAADLLRAKQANVLVCTKAFGMGMDIPNVHLCVHHRPPSFIEDYLQEVGRIGRSESERIASGHELVSAALLFNQADIARNLNFVHAEALGPPDMELFFKYCLAQSHELEADDQSLCIVPAEVHLDENTQFNEDKVTRALFWLERMGVLRVEGRIRPTMQLSVDIKALKLAARRKGSAAVLAKSLVEIINLSSEILQERGAVKDKPRSGFKNDSSFPRIVRAILSGVLSLVSSPGSKAHRQTPSPRFEPDPSKNQIDVEVTIESLVESTAFRNIDDLFSNLLALSKAEVLSLNRSLVVSKYSWPSNEEIWELIDHALSLLLNSTNGELGLLSRKQLEANLRQWYGEQFFGLEQNQSSSPDYQGIQASQVQQIKRECYRAINCALRIARYTGVEIRDIIHDQNELQYGRALTDSLAHKSMQRASEIVGQLQNLFDVVQSREPSTLQPGSTFEIPLTEIFDGYDEELFYSQLGKLIVLLEKAGFYSFESELAAWGSLVSLQRLVPLEPYEPDVPSDSVIQRVYKDMLAKHQLQVLRAHAMVLLTAMPPEGQKAFIDRYFECANAEEIESLLEDTVGNVDDEIIANNAVLSELLSQVRQEKFEKEIERLNDNQRDICRAPYHKHILVNAGPGSGKTHVLMMRCAHLIHRQRLSPADILVLAFNRAVVHEIRDRIRTLFRDIGYGNYVNRLDVSTFHSFALRFQETSDQYEEDAIGDAVHHFAETITSNSEFAGQVAGRYKAILVDEFQDMNEDFYRVVINLLKNAKGGGMVIGDDDQDILTWNRRDWRKKHRVDCPLDGAHYFSDFRELMEPEEHQLTLNYRSVPDIVSRANSMIENVSKRVRFERMKQGVELEAHRDESGTVEIPFDESEVSSMVGESLDRGDSVAVLCRSNRECRQVYDQFVSENVVDSERIQLLGSEDFPLYQLRDSGALLDICHNRKVYDFIDPYSWNEILTEFVEGGFADPQRGQDFLEMLFELVQTEVGRPRVRNVINFIEEMRGSDVERLKAKVGLGDNRSKLTIATVHKVKGLQFDTVFVMPSDARFPLRNGHGQYNQFDPVDSAEEARLYYVAMTRAKTKVYAAWHDRERSWCTGRTYVGNDSTRRYILQGSPTEVFVSWPGLGTQIDLGLHEYIEGSICVGDNLTLQGPWIRHQNQTVGRLSNDTIPRLSNVGNRLRVSQVIRYTCGPYFKNKYPNLWNDLHTRSKDRGWFYIVLPDEG